MPLPTVNRTDPIFQTSWNSGMITTLPPEELPEDAAALIENFEFDDIANLSTRTSPSQLVDTNLGSRILALFTATFSNGTSKIVFVINTNLADLYWMNTDGTSVTKLADDVGPQNQRYYFVMFNNYIIFGYSTSGDTTGDLQKIDSAGTVSTLLSTYTAPFPTGSQIVIWNSRLWTFGTDTSGTLNTISGSKINDPTDFVLDNTDSGAIRIAIEPNDGDSIRALSVFKGNLIVYKSNKIYIVSAISAPATIPSNLRVDEYAHNIGCIHPATIQDVLDDQIFLSAQGVTSLTLSALGESKTSSLSRNIQELGEIKRTTNVFETAISNSCASLNVKHKQQYWLFVPASLGNGTDTTWVMDYSDIQKRDEFGFPLVRWSKFTGNIVSSIYAEFIKGTNAYLMVDDTSADKDIVLKYDPLTNPTTFTGTHTRRILSRAFGAATLRTLWHRFALTLKKLTTSVAYTASYYYDGYTTSSAGSYSESLTGTPANNNRTIWRSFKKNDSGKKANLVQIDITANTTDQGFTVKSMAIERTQLNFRRSTTKWNSD